MSQGAYGFRLTGGLLPSSLLVECPDSWAPIELVRDEGLPGTADFVVELGDTGRIGLERAQATARFCTPELSPEELVHPYLAPVIGMFAVWSDHLAFHGGAVVVDGRAWGVLGDRWDGKSSLLGQLAVGGHPIVSDDVLVTDGEVVFAGPRCVDLRADVAATLEVGRPLRAGLRDRWRLELEPVEAELTLAGWIVLGWGGQLETRRIAPSKRLGTLISHHLGLPIASATPETLLTMSELPAWELTRPKALDSLERSAQCLVELVS